MTTNKKVIIGLIALAVIGVIVYMIYKKRKEAKENAEAAALTIAAKTPNLANAASKIKENVLAANKLSLNAAAALGGLQV